MRTLSTTILLVLLLLELPPQAAVALTADGLALLAFKAAVTEDPLSALSTWSESDTDPCRWPGVTCANASSPAGAPPLVVGVAVAGKNISGYIPSELGSLLFLRRLNLHGNHLTGAIPAALSNASSLHSVFLYGNALTGELPVALCNLPRLQNLDVSRNSLSGKLPLDLRNCRSLQRLILAKNAFSGEVPASIWPEMANLQHLDLSSNNFNGSIPPDLGELPKLAGTLNLSHNLFSGVVAPELGRLPATVTLDLRFNNLSGAIPQTGSLASQGPTAFLNNPGLCGFPLQVPCRAVPPPTQSPSPPTTSPSSDSTSADQHHPIKTSLIALISVADAAGVALVGIILVYIYWKVKDRRDGRRGRAIGHDEDDDDNYRNKGLCRCLWVRRGGGADDSDGSSDDEEGGDGKYNGSEGELVVIDRRFRVELDELLRSSAYVLGKGGKGIVYKVVVGNGSTPVAVRRLGGGGGGADRCKEFAAEARAVGRVRHPNVVRLRAYYWSLDEKLVVTDFVGNGNLATALRAIRCTMASGKEHGAISTATASSGDQKNGGLRGKLNKVVLAYSGGLDTSVIVPWLRENYGCEVVCFTADVGQGAIEMEGLEKKAKASGASQLVVKDLKEEFVSEYIYPCLRAGAVYERKYLLGTSMARPVIAKAMVDVAKEVGADAVAHGCTGKGNDQVRFELTFYALNPELKVVAPWREWDITGREDAIEYAMKHNVPVPVSKKSIYSRDRNLWHLSHEGDILEDPANEPKEDMYMMSVAPESAPSKPEYLEVGIVAGVPISINGRDLSPASLLAELNDIGGKHGIGRIDMVENRLVGMKSRGVYETPGGTIMSAAVRELEALTLDRETMQSKDMLALKYAELVYAGRWFDPLRQSIDAFMEKITATTTGSVTLKLYKGSVNVASRKSPYSLYREDISSFENGEIYNQADAEGFIRLYGLPTRVRAMLEKGM